MRIKKIEIESDLLPIRIGNIVYVISLNDLQNSPMKKSINLLGVFRRINEGSLANSEYDGYIDSIDFVDSQLADAFTEEEKGILLNIDTVPLGEGYNIVIPTTIPGYLTSIFSSENLTVDLDILEKVSSVDIDKGDTAFINNMVVERPKEGPFYYIVKTK